jgi:hypothetical protein
MAHPLLHAPDVDFADYPRAEGVAQIVESQRPQPGATQSSAVAAQQRGGVEVAADLPDEDEIVGSREALALP